jgi:hypothetical protein
MPFAPPARIENEDHEAEEEVVRPDDADVSVYLKRIRKTILTDRAIHDQVSISRQRYSSVLTVLPRLLKPLCHLFGRTQNMKRPTYFV